MKKPVIILGTAHLDVTPGKCSPDGRFREPVWSREMVCRLKIALEERGFLVYIDYPELKPNLQMQGSTWSVQQSRELRYRVSVVNAICNQYGSQNCLYISIHNNGCPPNDGQWHKATGFVAIVSRNASSMSKRLAQLIYGHAAELGLSGNRAVPAERYWVQNLYVLRETSCPAVLTENLFQDNRGDVAILESDSGKEMLLNAHIRGIEDYTREFFGYA